MIRVRIVQCLCGPARHAILAMALGPDTEDATDVFSDPAAVGGLRLIVEALVTGHGADLQLGVGAAIPSAHESVVRMRRTRARLGTKSGGRFRLRIGRPRSESCVRTRRKMHPPALDLPRSILRRQGPAIPAVRYTDALETCVGRMAWNPPLCTSGS